MEDVNIILSFIWVAVMLCFLLGDVLRIYAGDYKSGEVDGKAVSHKMYFGMAIIMVIPIVMVVLSIILEFPVNGWVNITVAIIFFVFNLVGIKGYKAYDIFLLIVSFVFNALTVWYALARLLT